MSPSGLFPPMRDPACSFLLQSMKSKDAFWAPCQYTPSRSSPFAMPHSLRFLPSAVLHRWMCPPTIPTSCSYSSLLPQLCPCAPALFSLVTSMHLGQSFPWAMEKHCTRSCCKNPLNQMQVLRKCSCQTPEQTVATHLQQKRHF